MSRPSRAVIEGVPKVAFAPIHDGQWEFTPFPSCLRAVCRHLGRDLAYHYLLGASGAAFRLVWHKHRWEAGNVDTMYMDPDPLAPARRAIQAAGCAGRFLMKSGSARGLDSDEARRTYLAPVACDDEAEFRSCIVQSIGAGIPVIAFGVVGPPEACIVAGYDDGGGTLIGWSMFQDDADPLADPPPERETGPSGVEPSGYFRRDDWFPRTDGIVALTMGPPADLDAVYRAAMERVPTVLRGPAVGAFHTGTAAYDAYIAAMTDDTQFAGVDRSGLGLRKMTHYDAMTMIAERGNGARFVRDVAGRAAFAPAGLELKAAAERFDLVVQQMEAWWRVVGRIWDDEDAQVQATADPAVRRAFVPYIAAARDHDVAARRHVEAALDALAASRRQL